MYTKMFLSKWVSVFTIVAALVLNVSALAKEEGVSFGYDQANLVVGRITIQKSMTEDDQVLLNDRLLFRGDDKHASWFIASAYPQKGLATHVLFGFDTGNNHCRYLHKVLEIGQDGKFIWSAEFGNCEKLPVEKASSRRKRPQNPVFARGEWRIGLDSGNRKKPDWYVCRSGKIFNNGKPVTKPED